MSFKPSVVGSCRTLPIALVVLVATSLVHHVHNAQFPGDYPSMPAWLSRAAIYAAWLVAAIVGVAGSMLLGGFDAIAHDVIAPLSAHSPAMHFTIVLEALAGAFLLVVIARRVHG